MRKRLALIVSSLWVFWLLMWLHVCVSADYGWDTVTLSEEEICQIWENIDVKSHPTLSL